jgi:hypothetical protein
MLRSFSPSIDGCRPYRALTGLTFDARIYLGLRSRARFSPGYNITGFQPS